MIDERRCHDCTHCCYYNNAMFCMLNVPHAARDVSEHGFPSCVKYEERDEDANVVSFDKRGFIQTCDTEGHVIINGDWFYRKPEREAETSKDIGKDVIHVNY